MEYLKNYRTIVDNVSKKWGKERILDLVSDDLRHKFLEAEKRFENSRRVLEGDQLKNLYEAMTRGWMALVKEAEELGFEPIAPTTIHYVHPNKKTTVVIVEQDWAFTAVHARHMNEENTYVVTLENLMQCVSWDILKTQSLFGKFGAPKVKSKRLKKK